jgi:hypothetical protein
VVPVIQSIPGGTSTLIPEKEKKNRGPRGSGGRYSSSVRHAFFEGPIKTFSGLKTLR